jgi:CubicO group peptidase (beta-lactamase class C family)
MTALKIEIDPSEAGFDAERLARIDRHFERYVDAGKLAGWHIAVCRGGRVVHSSTYGHRDIDAGLPFTDDTVVRMYSMTKPITSVAAMMLYEEGAFELKSPIARWLPEFADTPVYRSGTAIAPATEALDQPIRVWHLLTHTAGLTYAYHHHHPVDEIYRLAGYDFGTSPKGDDLAATVRKWAELPLVFQPGSGWNYGVSTDVLGRLVEVVSGMPLDEFFRTRILDPLGMDDTEFWVPEERQDRMATCYVPGREGVRPHPTRLATPPTRPPQLLSGGGGLTGTAGDYLRFCQLLLNRGELDGVRLLGSRTVDYMVRNHLPGGAELESFARSPSVETVYDGVGFGLGFSVVLDAVSNKVLRSPGEYSWGGAANTLFWVDPAEEIAVVFLTQLLPSGRYPLRSQLSQLVYQALVD